MSIKDDLLKGHYKVYAQTESDKVEIAKNDICLKVIKMVSGAWLLSQPCTSELGL